MAGWVPSGARKARRQAAVQRSGDLGHRHLGVQHRAARVHLRPHRFAGVGRCGRLGANDAAAALQHLRWCTRRPLRADPADGHLGPGLRAVAGRDGRGRGDERAARAGACVHGADVGLGGRIRARYRGDDPVACRRGSPGRGQRAQQHDRRAGSDRGSRIRRRIAGGRFAVTGIRSQRRQLCHLCRDRVSDHPAQPSRST